MNDSRVKVGKSPRPADLTDPYGNLVYAVGNEDDFWCFDFAFVEPDLPDDVVNLHDDIYVDEDPSVQPLVAGNPWVYDTRERMARAPMRAARSTSRSRRSSSERSRLHRGEGPTIYEEDVKHDTKGWNQDPYYFARCVCAAVEGRPIHEVPRIEDKP